MLQFINQNQTTIETTIKIILYLSMFTGSLAIINKKYKEGFKIIGTCIVFYCLTFISINL